MIGFIQNLGAGEIVAILLVLIVLFGAKRIPELARALGKSVSEFKKGQSDGDSGASGEGKETGSKDDKPS